MQTKRILIATMMLIAAILACGTPFATPAQPPNVETVVASTFQALTETAPQASVTQPPSTSSLLPSSLYFLNNDSAGLLQVYRLEIDGKTVKQITFEPARVDQFDVSPVDGSVAYTSNNQLLLVDSNGAGRRILVDGGPVDDNAIILNSVGSPVWSVDGQTIAFSHGGLNFYSLGDGGIRQVLQNEVDTSSGFVIARALYSPVRYSPDGTKLLISIGFWEGGAFGIYRPADNTVIRFERPDGNMVCCELRWVPDSSGLYAASSTLGMVDSGLSYLDASGGKVTVLLPGSAPDATYNFAAGPQVGRDGKLYFFFNNLPQIPAAENTPLYLVRSDTDGVTGRTNLQPSVFQNIREVLWAPDASLALVGYVLASAGTPGVFEAGQVQVVYPDGRASVTIIQAGQGMRWGP